MTKEEFLNKSCEDWGALYSSFYVMNSDIDSVVNALSVFKEENIVNGKEENGVIYFECFKTDPAGAAKDLSMKLPDAIVYSSTDWECHFITAAKNGEMYDDFTASFQDIDEWEEEDITYHECTVVVKDNFTGYEMKIGGGLIEQEEYNCLKSFAEKYADTEELELE